MTTPKLTSPLTFEPIFMERVWGGRRLAKEFSKNLPPNVCIGESWEMVDRPEAQSIVGSGPLRGKSLHDLWTQDRSEIFGNVRKSERFPLLLKLLDAREKLSLQVHPPAEIAKMLGGEPKTEFWYVAAANPESEIYVGLREPMTREQFKRTLEEKTVEDCVHTIRVQAGDAMFLPAGRFHAVGAGNLLVEIQQNSDTTYRVFDWNRSGNSGTPRQLHIDEALQSIDFNDTAPSLVQQRGELLAKDDLFEVQEWNLGGPREIASPGQFAIVFCITGGIQCADINLAPGDFVLVPASMPDRQVKPIKEKTSLLRVTIPAGSGSY